MGATKKEVLLAVAASEFNKTTHVHFMPVGKSFIMMLRSLRSTGYIESLNTNYYALTEKGWNYLRRLDVERFKGIDEAINKFVDDLP